VDVPRDELQDERDENQRLRGLLQDEIVEGLRRDIAELRENDKWLARLLIGVLVSVTVAVTVLLLTNAVG